MGSRAVVYNLVMGLYVTYSSSIQSGNGHVESRQVVYSLVLGMLVAEQ